MPSPPDPTRRLRRASLALWLVGGLACLACGAWAVRVPPAAPKPAVDLAPPPPPDEGEQQAVVDPAAFQVRLWDPPPASAPAPPAKIAEQPRRSSLDLQLIGITRENGILYAAVYEPKTDQLHVLRDGDRVADHTVTRVDADGVEFSDGHTIQRLALKQRGRSSS